MKDYLPYISLLLTIIGLIFRNQLSHIGDNLIKKKEKVKNIVISIILLSLVFGFPIYGLYSNYTSPTFDKKTVFAIAFYMCALSISFFSIAMNAFYYTKREVQDEIDIKLKQVIDDYKHQLALEREAHLVHEAERKALAEATKLWINDTKKENG